MFSPLVARPAGCFFLRLVPVRKLLTKPCFHLPDWHRQNRLTWKPRA